EISEYPTVDLKAIEKQFKNLVSWGNDLQKFWIQSSYHLVDARQGAEKNGGRKRPPLSDFMKMTDDYVPSELVAKNARRNNKKVRWDPQLVAKNARRNNKKVRWDPQLDLQRLDDFGKLDRITQDQDDDDDEKKEDEDEDGEEDNENVEEDQDDGYTENIVFDDDDDGCEPLDDGGDEEGYY
nr:DNA-directed RNA polymerase III subunit RPC7-like [Tanacetum cinerariifolium]